MRDRIRICVLVVALALSIAVTPAQAWPEGDRGGRPAVGWWVAVVDALAELFGLATADGSLCIDPLGGCHS